MASKNLIPQYNKFKADLNGYAEVPFAEFRQKILPLRAKREPFDDEDAEYVQSLVNGGAGYALQRLFGEKHKAMTKQLGDKPLSPEPMSKADLIAHMKRLTKSCLTARWPPERFVAFAAYLDSTQTPKDLVKRDREKRREAAAALSTIPEGSLKDEDDWDAGEAPEGDQFAEMYRGAGPAFRRLVNEHLALAAEQAQTAKEDRDASKAERLARQASPS